MAGTRYINKDGHNIRLSSLDSRMFQIIRGGRSLMMDGKEYAIYNDGDGTKSTVKTMARLPAEGIVDLGDWK